LKNLILDIFHLDEIGIEADLDRPFPQQLGAERMDRPDIALFEVLEGLLQSGLDLVICLAPQPPLKLDLEAPAEFRRGFPREGDRGQLADAAPPGAEQRDHPVDQAFRLPGSRPGFDKQSLIQVLDDLSSGRRIRQSGARLRAYHQFLLIIRIF
jgi:hypothetical protein